MYLYDIYGVCRTLRCDGGVRDGHDDPHFLLLVTHQNIRQVVSDRRLVSVSIISIVNSPHSSQRIGGIERLGIMKLLFFISQEDNLIEISPQIVSKFY